MPSRAHFLLNLRRAESNVSFSPTLITDTLLASFPNGLLMTQSPFLLYSFLPICQSYFRLNRKFLILFAPLFLLRQHASAIHLALCFFFSPFPIRVRTLNLNEQSLSLFAPIYPGQTRTLPPFFPLFLILPIHLSLVLPSAISSS